MRNRTTVPMLAFAGWLVLSVGCERPAQPIQQHDELHRINRAGGKPVPRVVDGTPLRFDEITVSVVGPNNSTLGARSEWQLTDTSQNVQEFLRLRAAKARPDLEKGEATRLVLHCSYFDDAGAATGTDSLDVKIDGTSKGRIEFKSLGIGGRVRRIDVELEAIVWRSEAQETTIAVKSK